MDNRRDLSPESWLERVGGEWYVYTTSVGVAAEWPRSETESRGIAGAWTPWHDTDICVFRAPLRALLPVYQFAEGEPWCYINTDGDIAIATFSVHITSALPMGNLRAALLVAGSADSLRVLHEAMRSIEQEVE